MKTALITGASYGIGRELALSLSARGYEVMLVARNREKLENAVREIKDRGGKAYCIQADISKKDEVRNSLDYAAALWEKIDLAVLNAAIGTSGHIGPENFPTVYEMLDINLYGTLYYMEMLLHMMAEAGKGKIAVVSSMADVRGFSGSAAYCASKAALTRFTEALRIELRDSGIDIVTVRPGFVTTPMTSGNKHPMPFMIDARKAAEIICSGLEKGKKRIAFPWQTVAATYILKLLPDSLFEYLDRKKHPYNLS